MALQAGPVLEVEVPMGRVLQVASYLAAILLGISILMLLLGLGIAARPELFGMLGSYANPKVGLSLALSAGITAIGSALLSRVLILLGKDEGVGDRG